MKKLFSITVTCRFTLCGGNIFGQTTLKLGHINSQELFSAMPESDSAQKKLEKGKESDADYPGATAG